MMIPEINIIIPLYNEEQVFPLLIKRISKLLDQSTLSISVLLVDDGSSDATAVLMKQLSFIDARFSSMILSRNFGHQLALTAALSRVNASEAVLIIDGDLQDPPEMLEDMFTLCKEGYDVVYAVRETRKEGFFKVGFYKLFYRILQKIASIDIPLDSGDFSLLSRRVVDVLNDMPEESRYLRGMRSWVGFKQIGYKYSRPDRQAGNTQYSLIQLLKLAMNGVFNFSEFPIKFITFLGVSTMSIGVIYFIITLIKRFSSDYVPDGFTAIVFLIILFGGVQLISIGIIGEYLIRVFFQVKKRPLFIIKELIVDKKEVKKKDIESRLF
ncbi:glycosyltransferase [Flavobacterium cellulosilyticum]|uniref:Glycosyltransferase n=2 Tax=Flavobacterium cellulosilyticum TaxID=2541731 RepID=A0A4R5CGI5_9FLAO|nr:glycosyltransferase [Flavobacterium cellulosilyticum]